MVEEGVDTFVLPQQVAQVMLDLVMDPKSVAGTILECGADSVRKIEMYNNPGPSGLGRAVSEYASVVANAYAMMEKTFGK